MDHCDVLIVGAGPAGSSLAWALRNAGLDVVIVDKQKFPRDKVCAGWITPEIIEKLKIDLDVYAEENILQHIKGFRIGKIDGGDVKIDYSGKTISFGIRRIEFDHFLLKRCAARIITGKKVTNIKKDGEFWIINGTLRTRLLVGAGGNFCPVARMLFQHQHNGTKVVAQETEFKLTPEQESRCHVEHEFPEIYFSTDLTGYGWVFRKENYINIGLGSKDTHKLTQKVDKFLHYLILRNKIPGNIPCKFKGHAYLLYKYTTRPLLENHILLIGDAAGLAYSESGEGISPAIESALLAASVIKNAKGKYDSKNLTSYLAMIEKHFGKRDDVNKIKPASSWISRQIISKLLTTKLFARHIVLNRNFLHSNF